MSTFHRDDFLVNVPMKIAFATIYMMFYSIIISILKVCSAYEVNNKRLTSIFLVGYS